MNAINYAHASFGDVVRCEWLKRRRSLGAWLILGGALFTPAVILALRLLHPRQLAAVYAAPEFWAGLWRSAWESMAFFLLPIVAILATSLVVQIEVRNNAWKQVHALPLSLASIYASKLIVILAMLLQLCTLFTLGVMLCGLLPALLASGVPLPAAPPLRTFAADTLRYFVDCLPIVAAQYLLSLRFNHFLAPIGIGVLLWIAALGALTWQHAGWLPYAYTMLDYLASYPPPTRRVAAAGQNLQVNALVWFALLALAGYALFATRRQKG